MNLLEFSEQLPTFQSYNCDVIVVSGNKNVFKSDWVETPHNEQGVSSLKFPILFDAMGTIHQAYGVVPGANTIECGGFFIIGPDQKLYHMSINDLAVQIKAGEALKILKALQESHTVFSLLQGAARFLLLSFQDQTRDCCVRGRFRAMRF
ncbi:hypothetical protein R5R35_013043 [Gryllus longicercus]|uniref:thioredoxin-dependent peroxiredoxin n=1 Tax=Gryllus longicercus TaxID=2509291 RepID=A0AAN9VM24_9ORTH